MVLAVGAVCTSVSAIATRTHNQSHVARAAPSHQSVGAHRQAQQLIATLSMGSSRPRSRGVRRKNGVAMAALSTGQSRAATYFSSDTRPIILFDGVCNMCNGGVNFVLNYDRGTGNTRFAALQSDAGRALLQRCGRAPTDISSIVLVEKGRHLTKSDAVLRIAETLEAPFPELATLGWLVPGFIRDQIYDLIAANRYRMFGQSDTCRLSDPNEAARFISS